MLYFVGLGLGDARDITVKGLEIVKRCKKVYLEEYTSILTVGKSELEKFYGRPILIADRTMVEQNSDELLDGSAEEDVALLVVGDPFGATTHTDLAIRAKDKGIQYTIVHNASIMNAVGCCGLQLYCFGETVSVVFWTESWRPDSFYDKIASNRSRGLHTLCLLDIKIKEQSIDNLMRGRQIFEAPRFLTASQAAQQLLEIAENKRSSGLDPPAYDGESLCVGVARLGSDSQKVTVTSLRALTDLDLGPPLHSLIVPGPRLHPLEADMLRTFCDSSETSDTLDSLST